MTFESQEQPTIRCPKCKCKVVPVYKTEPRQPGASYQIQRRKCGYCLHTFKTRKTGLDPEGEPSPVPGDRP